VKRRPRNLTNFIITISLYTVYVDGHDEVVRLLLEAGAEVNVCDSLLVTPLHLAALGGFAAYFSFAAD